ncbi:MAG: DUF6027 family protein [Acidimicrobiales bacterium]
MHNDDTETIALTRWRGPWDDDDPDANFKTDVALYANVDPMTTIRRLGQSINVPEGALVHYVLAKWAAGGSGGLLELGPDMVHRLWAPIEEAERTDTDEARLAAFEQLRALISWLRIPLTEEGDASGY